MIDSKQLRDKIRPPAEGLRTVFQEFFRLEASGGIILIVMTLIALILANSPQSETFFAIWETKLTFGFGTWELSKPLILWINDGLMALFFFVIGLEIKREVLAGDLASPRRAALPLAAAVGGMLSLPSSTSSPISVKIASGDGEYPWRLTLPFRWAYLPF